MESYKSLQLAVFLSTTIYQEDKTLVLIFGVISFLCEFTLLGVFFLKKLIEYFLLEVADIL